MTPRLGDAKKRFKSNYLLADEFRLLKHLFTD